MNTLRLLLALLVHRIRRPRGPYAVTEIVDNHRRATARRRYPEM